MLIVKKEYLLIQPRPYSKVLLGEMNQVGLQSVKEQCGDKWFETSNSKKKTDDVED
jgi:hypothetical protein|tara:strand:+ start:693 stop:860 length:168 start_codon:yes stop_codon:yes gene_type:complete